MNSNSKRLTLKYYNEYMFQITEELLNNNLPTTPDYFSAVAQEVMNSIENNKEVTVKQAVRKILNDEKT